MPVENAVSALEFSGFRCQPADGSQDLTAELLCSRARSHHLVSSCVQHIILTAARKSGKVTTVKALPPACAGL